MDLGLIEPVAVRSDTLPPAMHTNAVLVGRDPVWIVDPGSPDREENERLAQQLARRNVGGIVLTHRHRDHVAGATMLAALLGAPILAHAITAEELRGKVKIDRTLAEGDALPLGGDREAQILFTPGHARGHIVLWEPVSRALVLGDMVAGIGSVLISAPDGDVALYLRSLARLRALEPKTLYPAHGPVIEPGVAKLDEYIAHRNKREHDIYMAVAGAGGGVSLGSVVDVVYATTPAFLRPWAMRSASAHLDKLLGEGRVSLRSGAREDISVYEETARFEVSRG
ncbi:MAG: MBL fold metallo-hydrolase [Deltaproteobacteria bacterium]|nr:MBL fold metallo-hydrolase [Deltaproteobacteria bacterium]